MFNAVANNTGVEAVPEMKKVIQAWLHQFDYQLFNPIYNLKKDAKDNKKSLDKLYKNKWNNIADAGNAELSDLRRTIKQNLNQKKIDQIVQKNINSQIDKILGISKDQVKRYFSAVNTSTDKIHKLDKKINKLSQKIDVDSKKRQEDQQQSQHKQITTIAVTTIVTACVVWLFL